MSACFVRALPLGVGLLADVIPAIPLMFSFDSLQPLMFSFDSLQSRLGTHRDCQLLRRTEGRAAAGSASFCVHVRTFLTSKRAVLPRHSHCTCRM